MNMKTDMYGEEPELLKEKEVLTREKAKEILERHLEWFNGPISESGSFEMPLFRNLILGDEVFSVFEGANLGAARFESCLIEGISFSRASLGDATFINCSLKEIDFSGANLLSVFIRKCSVDNLNFSRSNLNHATMKNLEIKNTQFDSARVSESEFYGSTFIDCSFYNSDASRADFSDCTFYDCNFWHADINSAIFTGAKLLKDTIIRGVHGKHDYGRHLIDNPPEKNLSEFADAVLDGVAG